MKIATVTLSSQSPYSQSRPHGETKPAKEAPGDFEARTWQHRIHVDEDSAVIIPAMAFQNCLAEAAKFLAKPIPGKGKSTYTKHFEAGVIVPASMKIYCQKTGDRIQPPAQGEILKQRLKSNPDMSLSKEDRQILESYVLKSNEAWGDWIFTPSDGVPGSGKRVWRCYPMISQWTGEVEIIIADDTITEDVFKDVLTQAGQLIGLGRFRVRNRGNYGRFSVKSIKWSELES